MLAGVALLISTFAMPVHVWRTGELPAPPLPLAPSAEKPLGETRLWIDTDAACGAGPRVDPDDCLALLLLARSGARIAGISTVSGNAPIEVVDATVREFVVEAARDGLSPPSVHSGAEAPAALRRGLEQGSLAVLALGPLTNIAAALRDRPDLAARVERLVVVMGRREGHLFHPSEGRGHGVLFGHGPVFRDFNYVQDRRAADEVLRLGAPLTMVPYEAARQVTLKRADLALARRRPARARVGGFPGARLAAVLAGRHRAGRVLPVRSRGGRCSSGAALFRMCCGARVDQPAAGTARLAGLGRLAVRRPRP